MRVFSRWIVCVQLDRTCVKCILLNVSYFALRTGFRQKVNDLTLQQPHWLPYIGFLIVARPDSQTLFLTFKALHGSAPLYFYMSVYTHVHLHMLTLVFWSSHRPKGISQSVGKRVFCLPCPIFMGYTTQRIREAGSVGMLLNLGWRHFCSQNTVECNLLFLSLLFLSQVIICSKTLGF